MTVRKDASGFSLVDATGAVLASGWTGPVSLTATGGGPVTLAGAGAQRRTRRALPRAAARARRRRRSRGRQRRLARELPARRRRERDAVGLEARGAGGAGDRRAHLRRGDAQARDEPVRPLSRRAQPGLPRPRGARARRRRPRSMRPPGRSCSIRASRSSPTSRRPRAGAPRPSRRSLPGVDPVPYLVSVDDPFDTISPYHDWTLSLNDRDLSQKAVYPGLVTGVQVDAYPSGRVNTVTLNGSAGPARAVGLARAQAPRAALDVVHRRRRGRPRRGRRRSRCTRASCATACCSRASRRPVRRPCRAAASPGWRDIATHAVADDGAVSFRRPVGEAARYRLVAGSLSSPRRARDPPLGARALRGRPGARLHGRLFPKGARGFVALQHVDRRPLDLGCARKDACRTARSGSPVRADGAAAGACAGAAPAASSARSRRSCAWARARWPGRRPTRWRRASGTSPRSTRSATRTRCRCRRTRRRRWP